jgi:hypothetical protein
MRTIRIATGEPGDDSFLQPFILQGSGGQSFQQNLQSTPTVRHCLVYVGMHLKIGRAAG